MSNRPNRLSSLHPLFGAVEIAHDLAITRNQKVYLDPVTGFQVCTSAYLQQLGRCCQNGCRHCPWQKVQMFELFVTISDHSGKNRQSFTVKAAISEQQAVLQHFKRLHPESEVHVIRVEREEKRD